MSVRDAFRYLQATIHTPPGVTEEGREDLGWCCSEHALVLALALEICGIESVIAEGELFYAGEGDSRRVFPHWFVVNELGVWDSSIRFGRIRGICETELPSNVEVTLSVGGLKLSEGANRRLEIAYWHQLSHNPQNFREVSSPTPFGKFLSTRVATHSIFWQKASHLVADILNGRAIVPNSLPSRRALIEQTLRGTNW